MEKSNKGILKIRVKEGESIFLGDSEIVIDQISGYCVHVVMIADKSIKITRSGAKTGNMVPDKKT